MAGVHNAEWFLMREPVLQKLGPVTVLRDDLIKGGTKSRFLPFLLGDAQEVVYASPFCGGAQLALAYIGWQMNKKITIFSAARRVENRHPRQTKAQQLGAVFKWVENGYMNVVNKRASDYAAINGALYLALGFDMPTAEDPFLEFFRTKVRKQVGDPSQVWCATSSGMLARCLGKAFPNSRIKAVTVGLHSRHSKQEFTSNVQLIEAPYRFEQPCRIKTPFPCCPNYERKAWELMTARRRGPVLFINVIGD